MEVAASLADRDTSADKSTREFVESHWSEPLIPRIVVSPVASSLFCPLSMCRLFGIISSAVDNFDVNALSDIEFNVWFNRIVFRTGIYLGSRKESKDEVPTLK